MINMGYTLGIQRDMQKDADGEFWGMAGNVFSLHKDTIWNDRFIMRGERSRTQAANVRFNPQVFDWLSGTAEYNSNYNGSMVKWRTDSADYINAGVTSSISLSSNLSMDVLLKGLADATAKTKLGAFFGSVEKGFDNVGLRTLGFTYSVSSELKNDYLGSDLIRSSQTGRLDFLRYQLGLSGIDEGSLLTGNMRDEAFGGMRYREKMDDDPNFYREDRRSVDRKYTFSSGIALKVPFEITFNPISLSWNKRIEVHPDTAYIDTSTTYPDLLVTVRSPALMKIGFISDAVQNLSVSSNFSFKRSLRNSGVLGKDQIDRFELFTTSSDYRLSKEMAYKFQLPHQSYTRVYAA